MIPVNGENKPILGLENTENTEAKKVSSRGDAEMLFFEGESKKRLLKSRYTSCEVGSDDWYIKSSQLKINDETKTAVATNATVEFKGVPILYTPWINFPYANQRKSGLLAPLWGTTTKSGFEILTPFYWNISPNMDATFASRYLSKRGLQGQAELRYLEEDYAGIVAAEYLPTDEMTNKNRYFAKIKHQHNFGDGWSGGVDAQTVSDNKYFSDLSTQIITTSKVNLLQQANINYSGDVWQFGALAQKYQTLDSKSFPYQRIPQLTLNGTKDWDWGTSRIQNQLTRFESDPNSTLAVKAGTRFSTYPSISMPITRPYGYVTPKIGVNYTSYSLDSIDAAYTPNYDKSADRTLPIFSLDSGLFFERDTRIVSRNYKQTLEPRLFYVYIPYQDQSRLPVFDTGIADLNMGTMFAENQYTGGDRINNANQLSMSLSSRMIDADTGEQRLAASVGQRFYFEDQKVCMPRNSITDPSDPDPSKCSSKDPLRTGASSDIVAAATARLVNKWNIDAGWQYNNDTGETVKGNISTRYNPEPGKVLNLSYRFTQNNLEQINASTQWPLGRGYYGLARANYSIREGSMIEGLAGIEYDAGCWQSRFVVQRVQTATADANFAMFFQLELGGMASIGSNPLQLINRNIPGYKSSGLLPDNYRQLYNE
jgi:LPS-assembly protein